MDAYEARFVLMVISENLFKVVLPVGRYTIISLGTGALVFGSVTVVLLVVGYSVVNSGSLGWMFGSLRFALSMVVPDRCFQAGWSCIGNIVPGYEGNGAVFEEDMMKEREITRPA